MEQTETNDQIMLFITAIPVSKTLDDLHNIIMTDYKLVLSTQDDFASTWL